MPRSSYHHGDLRRAVIEAGLLLVDATGAHELSLRGLARAVGVNHRAIAREFTDLRGVRAALSMEVLGGIRQALSEVAIDEDVRPALLALGVAYACHGARHPARYQLLYGPRLNGDGRHPELEKGFQEVFEPFRAVLRRGVEQGSLRPHDGFAETLKLGTTLHGFAHLAGLGRYGDLDDDGLEGWARRCVGLVVDGLWLRLQSHT